MAFRFRSGPQNPRSYGCLGSASMVHGGIVRYDAGTGFIEPAVAANAAVYGVWVDASVTANSTNGVTKGIIIPFEDGQIWEVDTTGDMAQTYVGTIVSVTDAVTMDEDDTGNTPLFETVGFLGATTDKKGLYTPMMKNFTAIGV